MPELKATDTNAEQSSQSTAEPSLPVDIDWLLELIYEKCGVKAMLKNYKCSIIGEGKGFLSICTRVQFEWDDQAPGYEKLPSGVVIKKPTLDKVARLGIEEFTEMMDAEALRDLHNREIRAYTFFNKHTPAPIPMAELFFAEPMSDSENGMLILGDLTDGTISLKFGEDVSQEKLLTLTEHVASVQAYGFNHSDYSDYILPIDFKKLKFIKANKEKIIKKAVEAFPEMPYSADDLLAMFQEATSDFQLNADPSTNGFTAVVTLGDCQPNNILWKSDPQGKPSNQVSAFLDFQICSIGYMISDIANTMVMGMSVKSRRDCEDEVFQRYLAVLREKSEKAVPSGAEREVKRLYRKFLCLSGLMGFPNIVQLFKHLGLDESKKAEVYERFLGVIEDSKIRDF